MITVNTGTLAYLPATLNISIYQGDTWIQDMTTTLNGVAYNFDACTVLMTIKTKSGETVRTLSSVSGGVTLTTGNIRMTMTSQQSTDLVCGSYVYDLQLTDQAGAVRTLLKGIFTVTKQVTA